MNNWRKVTLREVVTILGDGLHGTPKFSDDGDYYFINGNNLINGKIVVKSDTKRTTEEEYKKYKKHLNDRTILVSINGTLGNVALYNNEKCILGKSACYFNVKEEYAKMYIRYTLSDKKFQQHIFNYADGTTIKNVSLKTMREYSFMIPENIDEQKRIADVLSALDDKIEINNKINENLEAQAQAIFKQWFVDFEFPDAEGKPYKTNGGEFIDSELGEIPLGWNIGSIGDYCKVRSGFAFKSSWWLGEDSTEEKVKVIKIKCIDNSQINLNDCSFVSSDKCKLATEFLVNEGDLVIAMTGATLGKFAIVPKLNERLLVNQRVGKFFLGQKPIEKLPFLHLILKQDRVYNEIVNKGQGSAQPNISSSDIENVQIILPNKETIFDFNNKMNNVYKLISINKFENKLLSEIRDSLLPKLMNGEVRV